MKQDPEIKRHGDLEIEEAPAAKAKNDLIQNLGRKLSLLIISLTLFGVFGGGHMSKSLVTQSNARIQFEHIAYQNTENIYRIHVMPSQERETLRISIINKTLRSLSFQEMLPPPTKTILAGKWTIFEFERENKLDTEEVAIKFKPESFGLFDIKIGTGDDKPIELKQLILP